MKAFLSSITVIIGVAVISAQVPFGGFSAPQAFRDNVPDVIDSSFILSPITKSADKNDLDFRLEHRDERGRMRLFRGEMGVFADGKDYYVADGTHGFGAPRFRKLIRCEDGDFSYFRRVSTAPAGVAGHSQDGVTETWLILDSDGQSIFELTDKMVKHYLMRENPMLYNEYSDKKTRNGSPIDYIRRICN